MSGSEKNSREKQLLKLISGHVDLPKVTGRYVLGLLITAGAILLLPLLYLAVIVLLIATDYALLQRGQVLAAALIGMILLGLLKPFLAKTSATKRPYPLRRDAEPLLFEYVERLCESLGTSRPTSIHLSCDLNAGAEFRGGWLGSLSGQGISLHIGLPVVAGLTLRQFTGILTHELGHFSQRTAMRLEYIVRRTNYWLLQVAFEPDAIDEWIAYQRKAGGPFSFICYLFSRLIWVTRWIWLALAQLGTIISCLMSRQMEFNADRCEARAVGAATFKSTLWRMRKLSVAHQMSFRDVAMFFDEGRLPDNMIALATANIAFVTPKVRKSLRKIMTEEQTGLFDTHPSDRDRISSIEADGSPGCFAFAGAAKDLPATILFSRFDEISKVVTTQFYENLLNQKIKSKALHPVDKLLELQTARISAAKCLRRYFQTDIPPLRPLPLAPQSMDLPENPDETIEELKTCRERMLQELPAYIQLAPRYQTAEDTYYETVAAQTLAQVQLPFDPADFHLAQASSELIAEKLGRSREGVSKLASKLLPFETEAGNRLSFAMQLMQIPEIYEKLPRGDDLFYEVQQLLPEAQFASGLISELPSLRVIFQRLISLIEHFGRDEKNRVALERIREQASTLRKRLISIQLKMGEHLYPFDHARAETTLRDYALPLIPAEHDVGKLVEATDHLQSRLVMIQLRLFSHLAQTAEKVERAIGLPPLPEPEEGAES